MNRDPIFELNWVQHPAPNAPEPWIRFEVVDNDKNATTVYRADLRVCAHARCACHSVLIDCAPLLPDGTQAEQRSRWFWIDVRSRSVVSSPELKDAQTHRLAEFVRARLNENAWDELQKWFWTAKIQSIEKSDPSSIAIDGLPEAENGGMVRFVEVFPLGLSLNFAFESAAWAADEQYCVQPKCTCTELVLSFLQLKDSGGTVATTVENVPACRYNYRSRALDVLALGAAGTPPLSQLLTALHAAHPHLHVRLELHHHLMQSLYLRRKVTQIRTQLDNLGPQLPAASPKIGRNVPCPCGSGKKYKRCCGA